MKIALIGQSAFGEAVLKAIAERDDDQVVGVFCPPDREGRPADPIKNAAQELDVPVFQFKRMRNQEAIDQFKTLAPDLCVMAYVTDIVPMDMIEFPPQGTIQYHPSLLPKHRGPSAINWAIIFGELETGLTIFWPDDGLDTGPILLQKSVAIGPDDTVGSLYFNQLFPMGVDAIMESIDLVRSGQALKIPQDESQATYESWCGADDAQIEWPKPAQQVYNLVRGCNPQPGAHTSHGGERLKIFDCEPRSAEQGVPPGTVVSLGDDGFEVATARGNLLVKRVQPPGSKKIPAAEYAAASGLKEGDVLGG